MVFAMEDSPGYMQGGFDAVAAMLDNQPKVQVAFKTGGGGVAWGDQATCMFCAWPASSARITSTLCCRNGCPRSRVSWRSSNAAPRWPTWAAGTAGRPC
jgi:hypothetical protein